MSDNNIHEHTHTDEHGNAYTHVHTHDSEENAPHKHSHSHTPQFKKNVLNRLSKASGHLESVKRMVEDDRDCSEVIMQLMAVKSALASTAKYVLKEHMAHCIVDAIKEEDMEKITDLEMIIDYFM